MKKTIFGCALMISGMMGTMGIINGYSYNISESIIKDIFGYSKFDGIGMFLYFVVAITGVIIAMVNMRGDD